MTEKSIHRDGSADATPPMTLAQKQAELRKFVALSDIQLQGLIDRISPNAVSRKVMQEDLAHQSAQMKEQIAALTSVQAADQLYQQFKTQFK